MTDLQLAKNNLAGHTICLCKDGACLTSDRRGIAPVMELIASGRDLHGYSVADKVVGKAAAMLFARGGIVRVYAKTLSQNGKRILELHSIGYEYETLAEYVINRAGTDICPMERAVSGTDDLEEGYEILKNQVRS